MLKTIDARNIPCPGPVIEAKKALKDMNQGTLLMLVDNFIAVQNLTKLASFLNLTADAKKIDETHYKVLFQAGEKTETQLETADESCYRDNRRKGVVVVLSSDCMGKGDDTLGKVLMKGFIYALTELNQLPETILLYNAGARMTVEDSESLQDLKLLESQGVEIMTCGACLNHYGLSEKLAVGTVTNMYVIAEKMTGAESIVKP